ncbi:MAG: hypothetical protein HY744_20515 [Deltaproteobacteria bacterium]|nr:hypothetical protein [Deltaproteobacteria bacterium]
MGAAGGSSGWVGTLAGAGFATALAAAGCNATLNCGSESCKACCDDPYVGTVVNCNGSCKCQNDCIPL